MPLVSREDSYFIVFHLGQSEMCQMDRCRKVPALELYEIFADFLTSISTGKFERNRALSRYPFAMRTMSVISIVALFALPVVAVPRISAVRLLLGHYKLDNSFPSTARMPLTSPPIFLIIVVIFYYNKL